MKTQSPLEKFLVKHRKTCTIFRFSDQDKRKCSCGRDLAQKQYDDMLAKIIALELKVSDLNFELEDAW